jgi:GNAT superfamily N-acetyltransferase
MSDEQGIISFGEELNYRWRYITIDPPFGYPIMCDGIEIGGYLTRQEIWRGDVRVVMLEGIELSPSARGHGIGTEFVKQTLAQCDMIVGSITEDEPKPFWRKMGAELRPLPLENFPKRYLPTIHTKEPVLFFIANTPKARELGEIFAREVPELMKQEL